MWSRFTQTQTRVPSLWSPPNHHPVYPKFRCRLVPLCHRYVCLQQTIAQGSVAPPSSPLAKNDRYATFFPGQFGISTGRLGEFPGHSSLHHPHPLFPPIICSTWRGGRILSAGPLYSWRASDAVFGACLRMACTCLSQQHTGLWDVFLEAYQVLFSAGASVCLIQAPNPGKSGPNMPSKSFHYLPEKL